MDEVRNNTSGRKHNLKRKETPIDEVLLFESENGPTGQVNEYQDGCSSTCYPYYGTSIEHFPSQEIQETGMKVWTNFIALIETPESVPLNHDEFPWDTIWSGGKAHYLSRMEPLIPKPHQKQLGDMDLAKGRQHH